MASESRRSNWGRQRTGLRLVGVLLGLGLLTLACAVFSSGDSVSNRVRLAVYQHEREARGPADDLVIHAGRFEPRLHFAKHSGRTVWLSDIGAREYFALLPPEQSYLYIQEIQYVDDQTGAVVDVYRGTSSSYQGRTLALDRRADGTWEVVGETEIAGG